MILRIDEFLRACERLRRSMETSGLQITSAFRAFNQERPEAPPVHWPIEPRRPRHIDNFEWPRLAEFARRIFEAADWPDGGDIDGFTLQDIAVECKLLVPKVMHEPCGEECHCQSEGGYTAREWRIGVECYRKHPILIGNRKEKSDE